jgi:HAMP domain-containing protein
MPQDLYFEEPRFLSPANARFPHASAGADLLVTAYQEVEYAAEEDRGRYFITLNVSRDGVSWNERKRVLGPYQFVGAPAPVYSMAVTEEGIIHIAVAGSTDTLVTAYSADGGKSFVSSERESDQEITVAPRLFLTSRGGLILFLSQESGDALSTFFSLSADGSEWSELEQLDSDPARQYNFLPQYTVHNGNDIVVYQAFEPGESQYQIFMKISEDGGSTWKDPIWLTGFEEQVPGREAAANEYDNQRPFIASTGSSLALAWERSFGREQKRIYYAEFNEEGEITLSPEIVSAENSTGNFPATVYYGGSVYILWYDSRSTPERVYLSERRNGFWSRRQLSSPDGNASYPAIVSAEQKLYVFWQSRSEASAGIVYLEPDTRVKPPAIIPVNYEEGSRSRSSEVRLRWRPPQDASGIAGYNYAWNREKDFVPQKDRTVSRQTNDIELNADDDGLWYFHLAAQDFAGNWSKPSTVSYYRDTTAPEQVQFKEPEKDENGFLTSNTFSIEWEPPEEDFIAGYTYSFQYIGQADREFEAEEVRLAQVPDTVITDDPVFRRNNNDNGLWALSVSAVDSVGNIGKAETIFIRLNKYIPVTYVTIVDPEVDYLGRINLSIIGRGFTANGIIEEVIIDKDGEEPYDYTFNLESGAYEVINNRSIVGPAIENIQKGIYRLGLIHSDRGLYFSREQLFLESSGTIKYGDYSFRYRPAWSYREPSLFTVSSGSLLFYLIMGFLALVIIFATYRIGTLMREGQVLKMEVRALINGEQLSVEKKEERLEKMRKRGMGLRLKFTLLVTTLVIGIVLMVAFPLGLFIIDTQRETLGDGLRERAVVMLESLTSGAKEYLPAADTRQLDLANLINQISAMDEALYATITGLGLEDKTQYGYIWATNDPEIVGSGDEGRQESDAGIEKISTDEYEPGISRIDDEVSQYTDDLREEINNAADEALGPLVEDLSSLQRQAVDLLGTGTQAEIEEVQENIRILSSRIQTILNEISTQIYSYPEYRIDELIDAQTEYVFYKPILYLVSPPDGVYYRGLVRLGISTENIIQEIEVSRRNLIMRVGIITLIAIVIGVAGALLFATVTVIPINRLVRGVELIRDTEDKAQLAGHRINVKTKDELSVLADTVNQMTQSLVKAAVANKDLIMGKELQKMFIPLEKNNEGKKLTTGKVDTEHAEFFGYYEGAKGVSGDYFDFIKLDSTRYAVIKCDVAGKGVPAALIMVEVATIFIDHFKDFDPKKTASTLEPLVYRINDLLEERGFKGRFAALTICIFDSKNGSSLLCNAGDNLIHIYDNEKKQAVQREMPEAPAAGVFPSMLVEMQTGFKQVKMILKPGDIMVLFTDGLEESKRMYRNTDFEVISIGKTEQKDSGDGKEAVEDESQGQDNEEFSIERIHSVIAAIMNRQQYVLEKEHNPIPGEQLSFDFSSCSGSAEELVLALAAVEKIFRIYPDPSAGPDDQILVDEKILGFLKNHFDQFEHYFQHPLPVDEKSEYRSFSHIKEEDQYDDLTLLAIKKK